MSYTNSNTYYTADGLKDKKVFFSKNELMRAFDLFIKSVLTFHNKKYYY